MSGATIYAYVAGNPLSFTDPLGLVPKWMVPQTVVDNAQYTVGKLSGDSFSKPELATLTDALIGAVSIGQANQFKDIQAGSTVTLTKSQDALVNDIVSGLIKDNPKNPLFQKLQDQYNKAKKDGKCIVK